MADAVVIGASGGLGRAFTEALSVDDRFRTVHALSRSVATFDGVGIAPGGIDLEDESSIEAAAAAIADRSETLSRVIVAAGILHNPDMSPEKTWRTLSAQAMEKAFRINTTGPALVAKHFLSLLDREAPSVFACLSARVGSISDNRLGGWYAYRASKAALNMTIRSLAIELARQNRNGICVALHPGTVDTQLSKPFQSAVPDGKLFTPAYSAGKLLSVIDNLKPADSGKLFAWDGQEIPF